MQMNDMTLQMTLMNMLQQVQVSAAPGQASGSSQKTNFKDLLEQRRNDANGTDRQDAAQTQPGGSETAEQPQDSKDPAAPEAELTALAARQMLMANMFVSMEQFSAVQPESLSQTAPVQILAAQGSAPQADAAQMSGVPAQGQTQAAFTETVSDPQTLTAPVQQTAQTAASTDGQAGMAGMAEGLAQQLTQSGARQNESQAAEEAAVQSWSTPMFRDVEAAPVRVGDAPVDMTAPAQDVEKTLTSVLKSAAEQGDQFLEIRLSPNNLGNVVAEFIRSPEGALHVVLRAETEQAAKLLGNHASALSLMLQDNIRGEVRVEVPQPQQEQSLWQQPDQDGGRQQQQQQRQENTSRRTAESFLHQLRLGLVEMEDQAV